MAVQDDSREEFVRQLLGLTKPEDSGRSGTDAVLSLKGNRVVEFELKSATRGGVTTVRDFGPDHIRKWRGKHWLFGFFDRDGQTLTSCLYATPRQMEPWIREKEEYIRLDFELALLAPRVDRALYEQLLVRNFGDKDEYSLQDASRIQKRQYTAAEYRNRMDRPEGFSKERMLDILAERWQYLTKRGSTLNNPHIPASYFDGWDRLPIRSPLPLVLPVDRNTLEAVREARERLVRDVLRFFDEPDKPARR